MIIFIVRTHCPDPSINILISTLIHEIDQTTLRRLNLLSKHDKTACVLWTGEYNQPLGFNSLLNGKILRVISLSNFYCKLCCYH